MLTSLCLIILISSIEGAVLDPAMYLLPSPPISNKEIEASRLWSMEARALNTEIKPVSSVTETNREAASEPDMLQGSETFWPSLRSVRSEVHIPLTFRLTGTYGGYGPGLIGSTYTGISGLLNGRGKSGLAGSSYGSYYGNSGVRVYGGDTGPAWSGWGNGKWGHYGKG